LALIPDPRIDDQDTQLAAAKTEEEKVDIVLKTQVIMQKEDLFDVQFFAFLNAIMHLKMKNVEEDLKNAITKFRAQDQSKQDNGPVSTETVTPNIPVQIPELPSVVGPVGPVGPGGDDEARRKALEEQRQRDIEEQIRRK